MNRKSNKDYFYVGIQFILFVLYFITPPIFFVSKVLFALGLIFLLSGFIILGWSFLMLNKNLTPYPTPKKSGVLIVNGPYKYARHPIYTAVILLALGGALYAQNYSMLLFTGMLIILFYFKSSYEESLLIEKYGEKYLQYKSKTGRFF